MNIQQIDYILAVSKTKNFGKAAKLCFITQSTLSTMIARFEAEIGITIFDRKTKPVTITKEGVHLIEQLKIIAKEIASLKEVVNTMKGEVSGSLQIGVIPTVAPYLLPIFLKDFVEQFPKIHFVVSEMTTEKIIDYLRKRDLDIGIVSTPLGTADLVEIPLYDEPFILYDKADGIPVNDFTITDIDFNRLWLLEDGHCMRAQVESICGLHKERTNYNNLDYKSGTIDTLMKFVNKYNGATLLPQLATTDFSEAEQLHLSQFKAPVPARTVGLVVHPHFVKKEILQLLQQEIQQKVAPLLGNNDFEHRIISPVGER